MEIIPAVMPKTYAELDAAVSKVVGTVRTVQADIMDGQFVPEVTWPYVGDEGTAAKLDDGTAGLPQWEDIDIEADLMVADQLGAARRWLQWGASRVILHYEALEEPPAALRELAAWRGADEQDVGTAALGIALNPDTPTSVLDTVISDIDFVQFMGIARIGYQGEPFDNRVLAKIRDFHLASPDVTIQVDGGVSADTVADLAAAGATRLVSGSAIWEHESGDAAVAIEELIHAAV